MLWKRRNDKNIENGRNQLWNVDNQLRNIPDFSTDDFARGRLFIANKSYRERAEAGRRDHPRWGSRQWFREKSHLCWRFVLPDTSLPSGIENLIRTHLPLASPLNLNNNKLTISAISLSLAMIRPLFSLSLAMTRPLLSVQFCLLCSIESMLMWIWKT